MIRKQHLGFVVGAALSALTIHTSANATVIVSTEAKLFADGALITTGTASSPISAITSKSNDDSSAYASSHVSGNLTTIADAGSSGAVAMMMMAFPDPAGAASVRAFARWEDTITNNTGTQVGYKWAFHVVNPRLGNGGHADDFAGLGINILVNGTGVWQATATLDNCVLTSTNMSLTQFGEPCRADGPSFDVVADLGVFASGASFTVAYEMLAFADTGDTDSEHYWGTYAGIGDPFGIDGEGGEIIATPLATTVPEPGTLALLGVAALGIGFMRRKRVS